MTDDVQVAIRVLRDQARRLLNAAALLEGCEHAPPSGEGPRPSICRVAPAVTKPQAVSGRPKTTSGAGHRRRSTVVSRERLAPILAAVGETLMSVSAIATKCQLSYAQTWWCLRQLVKEGRLQREGTNYRRAASTKAPAAAVSAGKIVWAGRKDDKPLSSYQSKTGDL